MPTAGITHTKISAVPDAAEPDLVCTDDWNATHTITLPVVVGTFTFNVGGVFITSGGTLNFTGMKIVCAEAQMTGDLNHDGNNIGFFGKAPTSRTNVAVLGVVTVASNDVAAINVALASLQEKLDEALVVLQGYGLLAAP